ncbi:uncharacterized protein [Porites lutea]|uniref:uncharacterized protein n=1 Tax=Porites lutea TaxID=51062 RepID=UPI003CC5A461
MDCFLLVFTALVLQPVWCSSNNVQKYEVTVEACERESGAKRFLKSEWMENAQRFKVSFTGNKEESAARFIYTSDWTSVGTVSGTMQFSLQPVLFPDSFLAVEGKRLVVKNSSIFESFEDKHFFQSSTVTLQYRDAQGNADVIENYKMVRTRSKPVRVLKSSKAGRVSLDKWKTWRDCSTWFKISIVQ